MLVLSVSSKSRQAPLKQNRTRITTCLPTLSSQVVSDMGDKVDELHTKLIGGRKGGRRGRCAPTLPRPSALPSFPVLARAFVSQALGAPEYGFSPRPKRERKAF